MLARLANSALAIYQECSGSETETHCPRVLKLEKSNLLKPSVALGRSEDLSGCEVCRSQTGRGKSRRDLLLLSVC